jgi:sugar lactone lactonase YvrE
VGEGVYAAFWPLISALIDSFAVRGRLDGTPVALALEREGRPETVLSFPGKVLADPRGRRLYISDSNHHRIVAVDLESGQVRAVAGSGVRGFRDGSFDGAAFAYPQGMALSPEGGLLYVADAGNHAIRQLDLHAERVSTVAGTGERAYVGPHRSGKALEVALNSPWDVALEGRWLYVAMAGAHQLWVIDLGRGSVRSWVGSSLEGVQDGPPDQAALAQPSGLALDGAGRLYFVDAESSTVRWVELASGQVHTLAGGTADLFQYGDLDGLGPAARLQHPLDAVHHKGWVYVADSYNHKIKRIEIRSGAVETLWGSKPAWRDGRDPLFFEPGGLDAAVGRLYVADTNNHAVRVIDLESGETHTLALKGVEWFPLVGETQPAIRDVRLAPLRAAAGEGAIRFDVRLAEGYKVNEWAPSTLYWQVEGDIAVLPGEAKASFSGTDLPLPIPVLWKEGRGSWTGLLTLYYCRISAQGICLVERARIVAPMEVVGDGPTVIDVLYLAGDEKPGLSRNPRP